MTKIVALVPMRHHSQRVPGKNFRDLSGKPLFHHIIQTLLNVSELSGIVVDTDSPDVIAGLGAYFPSVMVIERPEHLRADDVPMNEVLLHDTSKIQSDFYLQTHSTNPLLRAETISDAIQSLLKNIPSYDSLFSVTRWQTRLWDQLGRAINHNPQILLQTNSCIYIFNRDTLVERRNRLGRRPMMYEIQAAEAWDIDEELDFAIVDFLMKNGLNR
ncbi:acylneuraminate cytidylyltransferase [bacterium SM23_57]|nr:MAG: acylneuraminate cytidylyltransferase [bacterium SM23_57]